MSFLVCIAKTGGLDDAGRACGLPPSMEGGKGLTAGMRHQVRINYIPADGHAPFGASIVSTPDRRLILAGRIRLDRRPELTQVLAPGGNRPSDDALCLAAYEKWGDAFLSHLHGDFSFVLWDEQTQRLLCARDRFGVRPLFWADAADAFVVSDDLDQIAKVGALSEAINGVWISSFLTNNFTAPAEDTVYARIRRVAPGTLLLLDGAKAEITRYWQLEIGDPLYLPKPRAYGEAFREKVTAALADRLEPGVTGVTMSGGLDSSTLAALSVALLKDPSRITAQTRVYRHLINDEEEFYSGLITSKLGVSHTIVPLDEATYDPHWFDLSETPVEPTDTIVSWRYERPLQTAMAERARVWLYGEGPDNALTFDWRPYFRWLARQRRFARLGLATAQFVATTPTREWKLAWQRLSRFNRLWIDAPPSVPDDWLNRDFADTIDHDHHCAQYHSFRTASHPWRPRAFTSFSSSIWPSMLELLDPVLTKAPIDYRHPYLDTRVIEFLVRLPPVPQSRGKAVMRQAMAGLLPQEILRRPKAPLVDNPMAHLLRRNSFPAFKPDSPICAYVDTSILEERFRKGQMHGPLLNTHVLNHWLVRRGYS